MSRLIKSERRRKQKNDLQVRTLIGARTSLSAAAGLKYKALFGCERAADKDVRAPFYRRV